MRDITVYAAPGKLELWLFMWCSGRNRWVKSLSGAQTNMSQCFFLVVWNHVSCLNLTWLHAWWYWAMRKALRQQLDYQVHNTIHSNYCAQPHGTQDKQQLMQTVTHLWKLDCAWWCLLWRTKQARIWKRKIWQNMKIAHKVEWENQQRIFY